MFKKNKKMQFHFYRNLPRATIASISIVTIIYLLVVTSYHAVLSTEEMLSANAVALVSKKNQYHIFNPNAMVIYNHDVIL